MPRLTAEQIAAGILHDDAAVRYEAQQYFSDSKSPKPDIMPAVIDAIAKFGRDKAFSKYGFMKDLTQTAATVGWAVEEWKTQRIPLHYRDALGGLLCSADPRLVLPYTSDLVVRGHIPGYSAEVVARRLASLELDEVAIWKKLHSISELADTKDLEDAEFWDEGLDLAEELGRRGPRFVVEMMEILNRDSKRTEGDSLNWLQGFCAKLAGELRYEPAAPILLAKFHNDDEFLAEECQFALTKIGADQTLEAIRREFADAVYGFQFSAIGVLHGVHADRTVPILTELLSTLGNSDLRNWMLRALVAQFSTEANEVVRQALLDDPNTFDVRDSLIDACTLMGQEFPELERWRVERKRAQEIREDFKKGWIAPQPSAFHKSTPIPPPAPKAGRNEPCPCGSGKKHKHCCMKGSSPI